MIKNEKCPFCKKGYEPEIIDENGVLTSVSGEVGMPGHEFDGNFFHCCHYELGEKPCPVCGEPPELCDECGWPEHCHIPEEGVYISEDEDLLPPHEFVHSGKRTYDTNPVFVLEK